jgi:hypothetical protein
MKIKAIVIDRTRDGKFKQLAIIADGVRYFVAHMANDVADAVSEKLNREDSNV